MIKNCKYCKKELKHKRTYCNMKCYLLAMSKLKYINNKKCSVCDKLYKSISDVCSRKCADKKRWANYKYKEYKCKICRINISKNNKSFLCHKCKSNKTFCKLHSRYYLKTKQCPICIFNKKNYNKKKCEKCGTLIYKRKHLCRECLIKKFEK